MTKIITRFFDDVSQANSAKFEMLYRQSFSPRIVGLYDYAQGLADDLSAAGVAPDAARAYEARMAAGGGAVLLVRADYKPLGVAKTARQTMARTGAVDIPGIVEEIYVKPRPKRALSILQDHPHMLKRTKERDRTTFHMADWPIPLISRRPPSTVSLLEPHARMAAFPWPLTIRREPYTGSIFSRHARMASFPIGLISRRKPFTGSIFSRHARMAAFPIPLTNRRKPYTGSILARHARMANWPFPHLINGKPGKNALVPGAPRMANFPIGLLSDRKPFTGSIFPRHARMARFPIPLISKREPFTGSVFERHARMANFPLPLVLSDGPADSVGNRKSLTLSSLFGVPTIIRRSAEP
ncbi:MAG: PucR family transcriptional regulator [Pseudomonadota bacterium]